MRWPDGRTFRPRGRKSALAERGTWTLDDCLQPGPRASLSSVAPRRPRINRRFRDWDCLLSSFHRSAAGFCCYIEAARWRLIAFCKVGGVRKNLLEIDEYRR